MGAQFWIFMRWFFVWCAAVEVLEERGERYPTQRVSVRRVGFVWLGVSLPRVAPVEWMLWGSRLSWVAGIFVLFAVVWKR